MLDLEAVDAAHAAAFLAERYAGQVSKVVHLGSGDWSKAFAFRHAEADYVIRFGALREDFDKDRWAVRYAAPELPIPGVVEVGEASAVGAAGRALGGFYASSQRLFGDFIDGVDAAQMRALLPAIFAALDAMRLADVSGSTGYGVWGGDGSAPHTSWRAVLLDAAEDRPTKRTHGWRARLEASATGAGPFDAAYRQLQSLVDMLPEDRHLIHSDLLHFNVLVSGDRITGVFDWGCALYGDFLYDLAWFCFWGAWYTAWDSIDFRAEALAHYARLGLEVPHFEERLRACQIHIGLEGQAYQAYAGYWDELVWTARRTLEVARQVP